MDGELPEATNEKRSGVCCRRACSRICHSFLVIVFFLIMAAALASLGVFASKHNNIDDELGSTVGDSKCILYTSQNQLEKDELSHGAGCLFAIWGGAAVALGAGLFMLSQFIKVAVAASLLSCVVCLELPLLFLLLIGSLAVSINTTLGLALACKGFKDNGAAGNSCSDYTIPSSKERFYEDVLISEILSWSVTGALLVTVVMYIIFTAAYCKRATGSRDDESTQSLIEKRVPPKPSGSFHSSVDQSKNPFI